MEVVRILAEKIDDFIEDCKDKKYIVYYKVNMSDGRYDRYLLTQKQLLKFMKEHELTDIEVFNIKDEVKINKIFEIQEN